MEAGCKVPEEGSRGKGLLPTEPSLVQQVGKLMLLDLICRVRGLGCSQPWAGYGPTSVS